MDFTIYTLKNGGQEGKTGPIWGWVSVGGGGHKEKVKEGKYCVSILYSCRKIEL
jgi:hypothetical protein